MAKKTKVTSKNTNGIRTVGSFFKSRQTQTVIGVFLVVFSIFLCITFISFLFNWEEDQSSINQLTDSTVKSKNWLGKIGAVLSHYGIYEGFGIGAFLLPYLLFISGLFWLLKTKTSKLIISWNWGMLSMLWISVAFGFVSKKYTVLSGIVGYELNDYIQTFTGKTGLAMILIFFFISYLTIRFKITPEVITSRFRARKKEVTDEFPDSILNRDPEEALDTSGQKSEFELSIENLQPTIEKHSDTSDMEEENTIEEVAIDVKEIAEEKHVTENLSAKLVKNFGEFDPKLELANYRFPAFNLLKQYNESISVDPQELELNKNKIVETLRNYKIGIAQIKATVGPTITLYEIVPDAGIRIAKIKNLEDDIALSLSALGIRIIAPMPGKGTIGIEVPNKKSTIVSMHSVISSKKFQESSMELPVALGKTISNETFIVDLAKMPHLLMAGATGQGKSVGLNVVLTSLLYRKHPAEVKFILVDPKKVELTLFNKIERHYLAKLPGSEEAIITDTTKVVHTLNSLCIEMDNRYDLLKTAMVRNIKEYNIKFRSRKLNPEFGHQFLPYIILVIDEFADLIMTAGKEIETPIARLTQLARAIGIHLIVATQRPSVNVITGIIKANFPSRIAFRVTSKIDSRTILDAHGADQLIGRGDMLYSGGSDIIRIQCAFIDTPEVEKITDFIGSQRAYPEAFLLPEYIDEDVDGTDIAIDITDRDKLFREAAEIIITAQQGSASLLQRKLKLGYNRAGRLIDQLEAAGIVGPFEGSKARQVLISDFTALEQLLENEKNI
ncbi:MAG: DNA translocase FtsK [Flavobacteriaceae bacterium]|nr:MAG: DNA translocase FtsK [Flavobacteriaceae bacterium]